MYILETASLSDIQKSVVMQLWNKKYPAQLGYAHMDEFNQYLDALSDKVHYLGTDYGGRIIGWALSFTRNSERWFAIIIDRSAQGQGNGTAMLDALKGKGERLTGWASDHECYVRFDGTPYPSPLAFYLRHGFIVREDVRLDIEKLSTVRIEWRPS